MNVALRLLMRGGPSAPTGLSGGTYQTSAGDEVDRTTYTFTGLAIGAASAYRNVIVGIVGRTGSTANVSSVTIGGVTATLVVDAGAGTQSGAIYRAVVPTGTTATVVVTWSAGMIRCAVNVWTLEGIITTTSTASLISSGTITRTVTGAVGGFIVATGYHSSSGRDYTWTGVTERFEGSPGSVAMTIAAADGTSSGSVNVVAAPGSGSTVLVVGAFGA